MFIYLFLLLSQVSVIKISETSLPQSIHRIVSLSPTMTEIVCALGGCDTLVGVTRFDDYPEVVKLIPKVGGVIDPSFEVIHKLKPDLVLLSSSAASLKIMAGLARLNVPYLAATDTSLEDYDPLVYAIANTLGVAIRGQALVQEFHRSLDVIGQMYLISNKHAVPSVLMVYGHHPLVVAGNGSFGAQLLRQLGLKNAYQGAKNYPVLNVETLLLQHPEWIIDTEMTGQSLQEDSLYKPHLEKLIQQGTLFVHSKDAALLRLGPRLPEALKRLSLQMAELRSKNKK